MSELHLQIKALAEKLPDHQRECIQIAAEADPNMALFLRGRASAFEDVENRLRSVLEKIDG